MLKILFRTESIVTFTESLKFLYHLVALIELQLVVERSSS